MTPVSVSAVENRNGVLTLYVLMSDGTILKKREDETNWTEMERVTVKTDTVSGHRDQPSTGSDMVSSNKGRKKRSN